MDVRHQVKGDWIFWERLEYDASRWLKNSDDNSLHRFWIDGFLPEVITNTTLGVDVAGIAWVGYGPRKQLRYRFLVSIPQRLLRFREHFFIRHLALDEARQTLQVEIAGGNLVVCPALRQPPRSGVRPKFGQTKAC